MTVTFSHHLLSVASRVGVLQVSAAGAAGAGEAEEAPGCGEFGAAGSLRRGWVPLRREEEPGEPVAGDGEVAAAAVVVAAGAGPVTAAVGPPAFLAPSSGTSVTDPVGRADVLGSPPAAPTAV
ncbi:hypothetical protein ACWGKQ_04125 [Streptomyces sp. NPDC054770]